MHHRLFVTGLIVGKILSIFGQGLTQSGDIAMTEYAKDPGDQTASLAVALAILHLQIFHQCLGHGQTNGLATHCL